MDVGPKSQREFMVRTDLIAALHRDAQARSVRPSHAFERLLMEFLAVDGPIPHLVPGDRDRLRTWLPLDVIGQLHRRARQEGVGPRVVVEAALLRLPAAGARRPSWDLGHRATAGGESR